MNFLFFYFFIAGFWFRVEAECNNFYIGIFCFGVMGNGIIVAASLVLPYSVGSKDGYVYVRTAKDGLWGLPGGKLEPFENDVSGVLRELREETGLVAEVVNFLGLWDLKSVRDSSVCNRIYSGKVVGGDLKRVRFKEILDVDVFSLDEVRKLNDYGILRPWQANLDSVGCYERGEVYPLSVVKSF